MKPLTKTILVGLTFLTIISLAAPALCTIGDGVLYVYTDSSYTPLAPWDSCGGPGGKNAHFAVMNGEIVYIQISGITEFTVGQTITVEIDVEIGGVEHKKTWTKTVKNLASGNGGIGVGDHLDPITWTVGTFDDGTYPIPYCTTFPVKYRALTGGDKIIATGILSQIGHMHVIPDLPFGILAAIGACFAGLGAFRLRRRKD